MKISDILIEKRVVSTWIADLMQGKNDRSNYVVRMTLNNGRLYYIYGIKRAEFNKWHSQASKGKYFHTDIKGFYDISRGSA